MANDSNELKNNAPCEERQEARQLTEEELENVNGGSIGVGGTTFPQTVVLMTGARVVMAGVDGAVRQR